MRLWSRSGVKLQLLRVVYLHHLSLGVARCARIGTRKKAKQMICIFIAHKNHVKSELIRFRSLSTNTCECAFCCYLH